MDLNQSNLGPRLRWDKIWIPVKIYYGMATGRARQGPKKGPVQTSTLCTVPPYKT